MTNSIDLNSLTPDSMDPYDPNSVAYNPKLTETKSVDHKGTTDHSTPAVVQNANPVPPNVKVDDENVVQSKRRDIRNVNRKA